MIYRFRILLIRIGKVLPFIICGVVLLSYIECVYSISIASYANYEGFYVPRKDISWAIAKAFEYDWTTMIVLTVLSIAISTCVWNKFAILYLCANLYEKEYFAVYELEKPTIIAICICNIAIAMLLIYKGMSVTLKP